MGGMGEGGDFNFQYFKKEFLSSEFQNWMDIV